MATPAPPTAALARWFLGDAPPRRRLIFFPHAGAGALAGRALQSPDTEVLVHRRPGRESRLAESSAVTVAGAAAEALAALRPVLAADDIPTGVLGHSFGALPAAEFTAAVERESPGRIECLVISAKDTPPHPDPQMAAIVEDDDALARWLLELGGTPEELLEDPGMREFILTPLRADLRASQSYASAAPEVSAPMLLVHAQEDRTASAVSMAGWARSTSGPVTTLTVPGGHHGLLEHPDLLHAALRGFLPGSRDAADEPGSGLPGGGR